jgi:flavin reductase (DIM6/NTAB) family NADH-FMN oxidoreductase RutF
MNPSDPAAYKLAMRRFPTAVNLITTRVGKQRGGFTASAVMSLTAAPPQVGVAVNKSVSAFEMFMESGRFCVNTLASHHSELASAFAGAVKGEQRFCSAAWTSMASGTPALSDAVLNLDCRIVQVVELSSHVMLVGLVEEVRTRDAAAPLLYVEGDWASLSPHQSLQPA